MRFISELAKRYDWFPDNFHAEWESAKTNPKAIWSTDEYGESVCSLLKMTSASTARKLRHRKGVQISEARVTDVMESMFRGSSTKFSGLLMWLTWNVEIVLRYFVEFTISCAIFGVLPTAQVQLMRVHCTKTPEVLISLVVTPWYLCVLVMVWLQ